MKFADKYELSDAVTAGRLETFIGRDVNSGERVLVHIFDAPVKKPDQPTVLWVMESFRALAPEPPGLVIATGRYGTTSYAYVVTQVPDDAALRKWTQAYELSIAETREVPAARSAPEKPPNLASRPSGSDVATPAFTHATHPPTGFFELRPPAKSAAEQSSQDVILAGAPTAAFSIDLEGISAGPQQSAAQREPGEFTKQFFVGSSKPLQPLENEAPVKLAPQGIDQAEVPLEKTSSTDPSPIRLDASLPDLGGFTALFRPTPKPEIREGLGSSRRIDPAPKVDDGKAGDFTRFFQGPFDGERPAEIPDLLPNLSSTPRGKVPGEFTQMFGTDKNGSFVETSPPASTVEEPGIRTDAGSFTRSFSDAGQLSSTTPTPLPLNESKGNGSQKPPAFAEPKWTEPVLSPIEPTVKPPEPPVVPKLSPAAPRASVQSGATQVFSAPSRDSFTSVPPPPRGPSEYTRIISGGMAGLISSEEKPVAGESAAAGGLPTFKMPAPTVPGAPKIAASPAPKLPAAPAAPKAPQLGALAPKPKPSYLPMIIILNASLIIAVLLIVYFAIKH